MFFLTDFGVEAESVGVCKAVIKGICPEAEIVDLCHGIPPYDVVAGALALEAAAAYLPAGGIVLAVVDPGVGTARRAVAVSAGKGHILVGPDNGLLWPAAKAMGGVTAAYAIANPAYMLHPVSFTFQARDIFAPAAAHLAAGVALESLGDRLDPTELVRLSWPLPRRVGDWLEVEVLAFDQFGSARLSARPSDLSQIGVAAGDLVAAELVEGVALPRSLLFGRTFADVNPGEPVLLADSDGRLLLAVNQGDAAAQYGLRKGLKLRIGPGDSRRFAERPGDDGS